MLEELVGVYPAVHVDYLRRNERVRHERVYDLCYPLGVPEPTGARGELLTRILVARQRLSALDQGCAATELTVTLCDDARGPARELTNPMRATFEAV